MNRYQLFKILRRHRSLSSQRAINYEQNKGAKYLVWFSSSFVLLYLMFIAIMLSMIANSSHSTTALEFTFGLAPFILLIDFGLRFLSQPTPSQIAKPYHLLPVPNYACIDTFIITSIVTPSNFIWFTMLVPFTLMSVVFTYGLWMALLFLVIWWLLIVANSQWYQICKTLTTDTLLWWLLPLGVYAVMALPILLLWGKAKGWENFFELYAGIGTLMERGSVLPIAGALGLAVILALINRRVQYAHARSELVKADAVKKQKVTQMNFLDRYGIQGLYIKLELKTIMRNKNPRKSIVTAFFVVSIFSMIISFTDIYDGNGFANFWCLYNYLIFSSMTLAQIMSYEGNYIDGLLTHKENLLCIFRTKYYINVVMLLWPMLLMLVTVFSGKWSPLMLVSYAIFTAGFQFFVLLQMAVYNKQTLPLNTKFISKVGMQTNYVQMVGSFAVFLLPPLLVSLLQMICSDTVSYLVMMAIGLVFIATHEIWLRNIYNRWMKRRYGNLESLRASR